MELARIRNICKQHFCPAIIALVGARAWPAVAVSDILYTLAPRNLLTGAAAGAVLQWMAAAEAEADAPPPGGALLLLPLLQPV